MSDIDSCSDNEVDLITFHNKSYYLISRSFTQPDTIIVCFQYFIYLLKSKNSFSHKVNSLKKTFRRQFRVFENQFVNNGSVQLSSNYIGSGSSAKNYFSNISPYF